jgi:hypothetical protein
VQHKWLRVRGAAGDVYLETSADGQSWTEQNHMTAPSWINDAMVIFGAGTWSVGAANPGTASFDKVNLPP